MSERLILDFDGTLVETSARQISVARHVISRAGFRWNNAHSETFWKRKRSGASTLQAFHYMGFPEKLALDWIAHIEDPEWITKDVPIKDVRQTLGKLNQLDYALTVLSARRNIPMLTKQVENLFPGMFEEVVGVSPDNAAKEKADWLLSRNQKPIGFIGDTESDASAARLAEVSFAAVSTGQRSLDFLQEQKIADIYSNLEAAVCKIIQGH